MKLEIIRDGKSKVIDKEKPVKEPVREIKGGSSLNTALIILSVAAVCIFIYTKIGL